LSLLQRRRDQAVHVIVACSRKQQRFAAGAEYLADAGENQVPHDLRAGRSAGLARHQRANALAGEIVGKQPYLG
jgi:hypothetical protein